MKVNIACGQVYAKSSDWLNFDFAPAGPEVRKANLLSELPVANGMADAVYSSHFLEHIPRSRVRPFLVECHRILKPNGRIRLVMPDFEEMAHEYLARRAAGDDEQADFVAIEIVDQCVRDRSGGELGALYERLQQTSASGSHETLVSYMRERTGHEIEPSAGTAGLMPRAEQRPFNERVQNVLHRLRLKAGIALLPEAFRLQNVSLAAVGERHHWLWDFAQLSKALREAGFADVTRWDCRTSGIANFPAAVLDLTPDSRPRKGRESMYVEAVKATS